MREKQNDPQIMTEQERNWRPTSEIVSEALLRPLIMLTTEPIMIAFSGYLCLIYGLVSCLGFCPHSVAVAEFLFFFFFLV